MCLLVSLLRDSVTVGSSVWARPKTQLLKKLNIFEKVPSKASSENTQNICLYLRSTCCLAPFNL